MGFVKFSGPRTDRKGQELVTIRCAMTIFVNDNLMKSFNTNAKYVTFEVDNGERKVGVRFLTDIPDARTFFKKITFERTGISFSAREVMRNFGIVQAVKTNLNFEKMGGMLIISTEGLRVFVEA